MDLETTLHMISLWERYPVLYVKTHGGYNKTGLKNDAIKEIANAIEKECKYSNKLYRVYCVHAIVIWFRQQLNYLVSYHKLLEKYVPKYPRVSEFQYMDILFTVEVVKRALVLQRRKMMRYLANPRPQSWRNQVQIDLMMFLRPHM